MESLLPAKSVQQSIIQDYMLQNDCTCQRVLTFLGRAEAMFNLNFVPNLVRHSGTNLVRHSGKLETFSVLWVAVGGLVGLGHVPAIATAAHWSVSSAVQMPHSAQYKCHSANAPQGVLT